MMSREEARTYMEDADEDGNPIDDTKTYVSTAPSAKEEANVSRSRKDTLFRKKDSSPATTNLHTDSDSTAHVRSSLKRESRRPKDKMRDKERSSSRKPGAYSSRPGPKSSKTLPNIHTSSSLRKPHEQSSFYGVSPTGAPSPILMAAASNSTRPRAYTASQRPSSYYGPSSRPPPANARFYPSLPHAAPGTSYPPQAPYAPPPSAPPYQSPFPPPSPGMPPQGDYFAPNLSSRFDYHRPQSAMARPAIAYGPEYDEPEEGGILIRQPSLTRRRSTRHDEDRIRMAPPLPRASTTRPQTTSMFPPPSSKRRSIGDVGSLYDEEDSFDEDDSLYQDVSPTEQYDYQPYPVRRPSVDSTAMYEMGPRFAEIAGRRSRRNSHYGARAQSTERDVEEKFQSALRYQQDLSDGPIDPLTTDSLRRFTKTPSGGTKSSGSRDESGYGRSAATGRTSVDNNEDMTILVKGTGQLSIGNAMLDIRDGAEINIRTGGGGSDRHSHGADGSDNASSAYDDRRTRYERPALRGRSNSQAGSYSRGFAAPPQLDYNGNPYHQMQMQYAPPYPYPYQY